MKKFDIAEYVRQIQENGLKTALANPKNVRELLQIVLPTIVRYIQFDQMKQEPTSFISDEFRKTEADTLLTAPMLNEHGKPRKQKIILYILIEHQSEPDRLMLSRLLEYVGQVLHKQRRKAERKRKAQGGKSGRLTGFLYQPLLPMIMYTGTRTWAKLGTFAEQFKAAKLCEPFLPKFEPLFLNLPTESVKHLTDTGEFFGQILHFLQNMRKNTTTVADTVQSVVTGLEPLAQKDHERWLELLTLLHALIYHERPEREHEALQKKVTASLTTQRRTEIEGMQKTIAQSLEEKGRTRGRAEGRAEEAVARTQSLLKTQLKARFPKIALRILKLIDATNDLELLEKWAIELVNANQLDDISFPKS